MAIARIEDLADLVADGAAEAAAFEVHRLRHGRRVVSYDGSADCLRSSLVPVRSRNRILRQIARAALSARAPRGAATVAQRRERPWTRRVVWPWSPVPSSGSGLPAAAAVYTAFFASDLLLPDRFRRGESVAISENSIVRIARWVS